MPVLLTLNIYLDNAPQKRNKKYKMVNYLKWSTEKSSLFTNVLALSNKISTDAGKASIDDMQYNMITAINEVSGKIGMKYQQTINKGRDRPPDKTWFDKDCQEMKKNVRRQMNICKMSGFNYDDTQNYLQLEKKYQCLIRDKKKTFFQTVYEAFFNVNNSKEFWGTIRKFRGRGPAFNSISMNQWEHFFHSVYPLVSDLDVHFFGVTHPLTDSRISQEEIIASLASARNGSSPGPDNINYEFYKHFPQNRLLYLETLMNKILLEEIIPKKWSNINNLQKGG